MGITFRKETFRDDYTFKNSPEHIRRFPFPFHEDSYMYAVNIEPHVVGPKGSVLENLIDVDEHYVAEMQDRALVLAEDPLRCQSLPHMTLAGWDLLELLMEQQALGYPEHFTLERDGDRWRWINRPLGIDDTFTFGDTSTLPYGPMEYITRQSQGDFCILDQRDGNLWMDAGMVTTQADWSLDFDIGMNFFEWHAPVPLAHEKGVFEEVTRARAQAATPGSSPAEQGRQEGILGQALGRLFAVAEAYPDLKASTNFLELQRELTETEDRIAAGRRFYNGNVRALNTRVESFPSNLVASMFGFHKAEYFEVEDEAVRSAPTVDFT